MSYTGSEFELQKYVVQLLRLTGRPDVVWYHVPNGEYRSPKTGARLKAMGVQRGVADLCLLIPRGPFQYGMACFLELKAAKGRQTPEQRAFMDAVVRGGARYAIAKSPEEARGILEGWGAIRSSTPVVREAA